MQKKLKVIQFFDQYGEDYQPYIPPIMNGLMKEDDLDISIFAIKGKPKSKLTILPTYNKKRLYKFLYFKNLKNSLTYEALLFLKQKPDIIHLQHSFLFPKIIGIYDQPLNTRPKIVITLRGADTYLRPWRKEKWRLFYEEYGNKIDAFITVSEHQKKYLTKWGVEEDRIHVIPISFGNLSHQPVKKSIGTTINIVSVHRMTWEKNIEGNLRTIKAIKDKGEKVKYHIFGDGRDASQVYYLIDKYQLSDSVKYHGKVKNDLIKDHFKSCDILLQLSHSESFGVSVVEAQSYGLPAIISNSDGIPETIVNGFTGYCFNPWDVENAANEIIRLKNNPKVYSEMSRAAIDNANTKFTYDLEINKLVGLYKNLVNH